MSYVPSLKEMLGRIYPLTLCMCVYMCVFIVDVLNKLCPPELPLSPPAAKKSSHQHRHHHCLSRICQTRSTRESGRNCKPRVRLQKFPFKRQPTRRSEIALMRLPIELHRQDTRYQIPPITGQLQMNIHLDCDSSVSILNQRINNSQGKQYGFYEEGNMGT